jgi:hypothetical protein
MNAERREEIALCYTVTPSGCWEWSGAQTLSCGYGVLTINRVRVRAHRLAWELVHGPVPAGMFVCHHCDNPRCVRPAHLFLGTPRDNVEDMIAKGRAVLAAGPRGSGHGMAKLDESAVARILRRGNAGERRLDIASDYGVDPSTVGLILRRKTWAHVRPEAT